MHVTVVTKMSDRCSRYTLAFHKQILHTLCYVQVQAKAVDAHP